MGLRWRKKPRAPGPNPWPLAYELRMDDPGGPIVMAVAQEAGGGEFFWYSVMGGLRANTCRTPGTLGECKAEAKAAVAEALRRRADRFAARFIRAIGRPGGGATGQERNHAGSETMPNEPTQIVYVVTSWGAGTGGTMIRGAASTREMAEATIAALERELPDAEFGFEVHRVDDLIHHKVGKVFHAAVRLDDGSDHMAGSATFGPDQTGLPTILRHPTRGHASRAGRRDSSHPTRRHVWACSPTSYEHALALARAEREAWLADLAADD